MHTSQTANNTWACYIRVAGDVVVAYQANHRQAARKGALAMLVKATRAAK